MITGAEQLAALAIKLEQATQAADAKARESLAPNRWEFSRGGPAGVLERILQSKIEEAVATALESA